MDSGGIGYANQVVTVPQTDGARFVRIADNSHSMVQIHTYPSGWVAPRYAGVIGSPCRNN
jgi:hypothetical protein